MKTSFNKILVGLIITAFALTAVVFVDRIRRDDSDRIATDVPATDIDTPANTSTSEPDTNTIPTSSAEIKDTVLLSVPFTSQAPTANWDELHNEACEEASVIMAAAYFNGDRQTTIPAETVETQIASLTEWQKKTFGYYLSINTEETVQMLEANYDVQGTIIDNFTEADFKRILSEGKLIILPANGRLLENPNFKQPGPIYHMLVVIGYDDEGFITNDPGTRKGRRYRYSYETLHEATGQWDGSTHTTNTNIKQAIIVSK